MVIIFELDYTFSEINDVRDNFMVGVKYNSLDDLNGQALAWCNKVNGKVHATTNEIPFERLKREGLNPLKREYIITKSICAGCKKTASSCTAVISITCMIKQDRIPFDLTVHWIPPSAPETVLWAG